MESSSMVNTKAVEQLRSRQQLLSGWGRTAPTRATVFQPLSLDELALIMGCDHPRGVVARGLGRSYGDPAQNAGGTVIDMTGIKDVHDIDLRAGIVTVDAGMSLHRMMQLFVPLGLFVPVTPGTRYVTVGGAIASDIHGKNHHLDGTFCDHLLSFKLLTADGNVVNIDRRDHRWLFDATRGGMGMTGVILTAALRMLKIETSTVFVDTDRARNLDQLLQLMIDDDEHYRYSVAWVDTLATGSSSGRGVLYRGNHVSAKDRIEESGPLQPPHRSRLSIPDVVPGGVVGRFTAKAFNTVWYHKHPVQERQMPKSLSAFFHQLDMVEHSNRVYGKSGVIQHQSVIPDGEEAALRQILNILNREQAPTYLVVLKRTGQGAGMLSFPIKGWTLAVDIPARVAGLNRLLDRIDRIVLDAGGRLYLAKDARMKPEFVPEMYPEVRDWQEIVNRIDPNRRLNSDLVRRLNLRSS